MTLKSKIALIQTFCYFVLSSVSLKGKEKERTLNGIIQVIKYCYSYQLAHYDHENVLLLALLPIIASAQGILWNFFFILDTVNAAYLVFTDQMEHL